MGLGALKVCNTVKSPRVPLFEATEVNHRIVFPNEIVFEYDYPEYAYNATITRKMISIFDKAEIPYTLGYTGGKSIHCHVFIDFGEVTISETTKDRLTKIGFKPHWARNWIANHYLMPLLQQLGELPLGTAKLDESMLYANKLCREFGGLHEKSGNYKTWINQIPEKKPENYKVEYPPTPQLWHCQELLQKALCYVKAPIKKSSNYSFSPGGDANA